jgi:hypothetical protein
LALVPPRFAALLPFGVSAAFGEALLPVDARFAPRPELLAIDVSWGESAQRASAMPRARAVHRAEARRTGVGRNTFWTRPPDMGGVRAVPTERKAAL